jgi:hypothetical protein
MRSGDEHLGKHELEMHERMVAKLQRNEGGLVIIEYVVKWSQTAIHSLSSEPKNPAVVDTSLIGLAWMPHLWPSRDECVQGLNTVVQGSRGVK